MAQASTHSRAVDPLRTCRPGQGVRQVRDRDAPDEIPRPFGPKTGKRTKGQLGFPCGWCPYAFNCFPNATVEATEGGFYVRNNKVVIHANEES